MKGMELQEKATAKHNKAQQPQRGKEIQEKEAQKLKHTGNSLRKNLHLKGGC